MKSRQTKQKEFLETEVNNTHAFFNAEEIYEKVKDKDISLATVYRFLKEKKESQELHTYLCNRKTVYAKEKTSHCHFICEKTGKVIHFELDNIDFLKNKIPGTISSFQLEVRGTCTDCQKD